MHTSTSMVCQDLPRSRGLNEEGRVGRKGANLPDLPGARAAGDLFHLHSHLWRSRFLHFAYDKHNDEFNKLANVTGFKCRSKGQVLFTLYLTAPVLKHRARENEKCLGIDILSQKQE